MCSICHQTPCLPQCPNAEEPKTIFECNICGEPIVEGEDYYELDGCYFHEDCFRDDAAVILVEKYGAKRGVAEDSGGLYDDYDD